MLMKKILRLDNIPKLDGRNSVLIQDRVIYIKKEGKTYTAYDYETKIKLCVHIGGKEALIGFLNNQDLSKIEGVS